MNAVDEHQIYPTLAFANEIGQSSTRLLAAKEALIRSSNNSEEWEEKAGQALIERGEFVPRRLVASKDGDGGVGTT
jgi:hypothetical protein